MTSFVRNVLRDPALDHVRLLAIGSEEATTDLRGSARLSALPPSFDERELRLIGALKQLKANTATRGGKLRTLAKAVLRGAPRVEQHNDLQRMQLDAPANLGERIEARLLCLALDETDAMKRV